MRLKLLVLCMFVGILFVNIPSIITYAAEVGTVVTEEGVTTLVNTETDTTGTINETVETDDTDNTDETNDTEESVETEETVETDEIDESGETSEIEATTENEKSIAEKKAASEKKEVKVAAKKEVKVVAKKTTVKKYTDAQLRLLSSLIYCEANGESYQGKLAVAIVVMNRKRSSAFPDTVGDVIYQKCQFGPARNGSLDKALAAYDNGKFTSDNEKECIKAAKEALNGTESITVNGEKKNFSKYLFFSVRLNGTTFQLGNHQFK